MTKKSSTPSQKQMPRQPFPLFFFYVKYFKSMKYHFFSFNWTVMCFEVPPRLQCGAWQTQMKTVNEIQVFLFCCSYVWCFGTRKCWNVTAILAWSALKYCRVTHNTHSAVYWIKPTKLIPGENQFLHGSYYGTLLLICTRKKCVLPRLIKLSFNSTAFCLFRGDEEQAF